MAKFGDIETLSEISVRPALALCFNRFVLLPYRFCDKRSSQASIVTANFIEVANGVKGAVGAQSPPILVYDGDSVQLKNKEVIPNRIHHYPLAISAAFF